MATTEKKFLDKEGLAKLVQLIKKGIVEADDFLPFDKVGMGIIKQTSTSQYDGIAFVKDQFAAYVQDGLNVTYYNNWDNRERYNTALNGAPIEGKFYVNTTNGTINIWTGDKLSVLYSVELNKINDVLDSIPDEIITNLTSNGDTDTFTLRQEKKVRDGDETFDSSIAEEITIPSATEALAGLMSAEDKKKLNKAATLDDTGKIPANNLPSYVDDVVEYETKSAFPGTGEQGKIYVALDSNLTYRWSGTGYVEISPSLALGETANTAYAGDKGVELEKKLSALTGEVGTKADDTKTTEKIDAINDNIAKINRKAVETLELSSTDKLVALKTTTIEDAESEVYLRGATIGQAGVMTADDKNKLENTIYEEQQRQIAEKQRSTSEESRSTAESKRVTAENARVTAENSRVAAEQTREQSFTAKVGEVDTAIKNCNTATQGAERVDATITEANVLQVTDRNGAQKTLDLAAVAKANGVAEDVETLKETTDTLNGIDNRDISLEYEQTDWYCWGCNDADGIFPLEKWEIQNHKVQNWSIKCFPKIDISQFDSVEVYAIESGISSSTQTSLNKGLRLFVNGVYKVGINTPSAYTIYPQQLKENDSDEVVMLLTVNRNTTPYIKVSKKGSAAKKEELDKVSTLANENKASIITLTDTLNGITDRDISTEYKLEDYRIWISKDGDFSLNAWSVYNSQGTGWKSKAFPQINISDYESVEVYAIINGGSMSTVSQFKGGLHVFVNGKHKLGVNTPQTYTIYPQQLKENDSDEVVMLLSVQSTVTPYIKVSKKGITESDSKDITKIAICGDSLCGNNSALIVKEMNNILAKYSYTLVPRTMGGENMIGNLTRAGGLPIRVAEDFTIPADKTQINIKLLSGWMDSKGVYASNPYTSISDNPHNVKINGIEGNLQKIVAYGMCTYDSNKKFIKYYTAYPINQTTDNNVAYVRFCVNNPQVGVAHITIGGEAQDVDTLLSLEGSLDYTGAYKENSAFKTSDFIAVNKTTIYADALAVSDTYTFTRNEEGTATKCGKFNIGFDSALYNDQDAVHIWFTGQNGGYDTDEEWAEMIEQAARNFGEKFIVCSTALDRTTNSLVYAAQRKFGKRYLNLRDYTQNQAVYDGQRFGLIDSSKVASDYSTLFWGNDKVHQNNLLSYLWSVKMWNMIIDFGWMKGERVEDGSFYVK